MKNLIYKKFIKTSLISFCLIIFSPYVFSQTLINDEKIEKDPYYMSPYVGVQASTFTVKCPGTFTSNGFYHKHSRFGRKSSQGEAIALYAGFGTHHFTETDYDNPFYFGGEIGTDYRPSPKPQVGESGEETRLNANNSYYLDLIPGYLIMPKLLIYARLGGEYSNYKLKRTDSAGKTLEYDKDTDDVFGGRIGIGLEYAISNHITIRGDYTHIKMQKLEIAQKQEGVSTTQTSKVNFQYNFFNFSISYRF